MRPMRGTNLVRRDDCVSAAVVAGGLAARDTMADCLVGSATCLAISDDQTRTTATASPSYSYFQSPQTQLPLTILGL